MPEFVGSGGTILYLFTNPRIRCCGLCADHEHPPGPDGWKDTGCLVLSVCGGSAVSGGVHRLVLSSVGKLLH